ncbi:MAG: alpha/beta fold hydrolase [Verrucomicrobia bacterium]|nr:alpha/beta fold hydrolase [Verrucomicrobiota bacterium]
MRVFLCVFVALAALYISLVTMIPWLDWLVLYPTTEPVPAGKAVRRTISVASGDLEVWVSSSPLARVSGHPNFYLLCFCGNASRPEFGADADANLFPDKSMEVWGVNYPGYGGSTGPARLAKIGPAALAAFDALASIAGGRPIILLGLSLGTTVALYVAAHRRVAGVILQDPLALREMILGRHGWWNLWLLAGPLALKVPRELDSVANAKAVQAPGIIVTDQLDEVVPPKYQALVIQAYAGSKQVVSVPSGHHLSELTGSALLQVQNWTEKVLSVLK